MRGVKAAVEPALLSGREGRVSTTEGSQRATFVPPPATDWGCLCLHLVPPQTKHSEGSCSSFLSALTSVRTGAGFALFGLVSMAPTEG